MLVNLHYQEIYTLYKPLVYTHKLSQISGGKAYFYSNEDGSNSNTLYDAFAATMERGDVIDAEKRVQVTLHV